MLKQQTVEIVPYLLKVRSVPNINIEGQEFGAGDYIFGEYSEDPANANRNLPIGIPSIETKHYSYIQKDVNMWKDGILMMDAGGKITVDLSYNADLLKLKRLSDYPEPSLEFVDEIKDKFTEKIFVMYPDIETEGTNLERAIRGGVDHSLWLSNIIPVNEEDHLVAYMEQRSGSSTLYSTNGVARIDVIPKTRGEAIKKYNIIGHYIESCRHFHMSPEEILAERTREYMKSRATA